METKKDGILFAASYCRLIAHEGDMRALRAPRNRKMALKLVAFSLRHTAKELEAIAEKETNS